jgi:hypothetical protein
MFDNSGRTVTRTVSWNQAQDVKQQITIQHAQKRRRQHQDHVRLSYGHVKKDRKGLPLIRQD